LPQAIPPSRSLLKSALYKDSVILFGETTALVYSLTSDTWATRSEYRTGVSRFGLVLDNQFIYVVGGVMKKKNADNTDELQDTDEIRCTSVEDIILNKPAVWRHHAKLQTKPIACCLFTV